jgi:hypothetical protein
MLVAVVAAFCYALGTALILKAIAVLTVSNLGTSKDLDTAGAWIQFAAALAALVAVCGAGWELVLRKDWPSFWETVVGAVGTLLIAIGFLIGAASEANPAASVVAAVGFGVWAVLLLSRAARRSLAEQDAAGAPSPVRQRQAALWLGAACGVFVLAVGFGFSPGFGDKGVAIAEGVLEATGVAVLLAFLAAARMRGYLQSRAVPVVLVGLALLSAAFAATAVVAGLVLGPDATLTGLRVGGSIRYAIELAAVVALGLAAWTRVRELSRPISSRGTTSPSSAPVI